MDINKLDQMPIEELARYYVVMATHSLHSICRRLFATLYMLIDEEFWMDFGVHITRDWVYTLTFDRVYKKSQCIWYKFLRIILLHVDFNCNMSQFGFRHQFKSNQTIVIANDKPVLQYY